MSNTIQSTVLNLIGKVLDEGSTVTLRNGNKFSPAEEPVELNGQVLQVLLDRKKIEGRGRDLVTSFSADELEKKFSALESGVKKENAKFKTGIVVPSRMALLRKGTTASFGTFGNLIVGKNPGTFIFEPGSKSLADAGLTEAEKAERVVEPITDDKFAKLIGKEVLAIMVAARKANK